MFLIKNNYWQTRKTKEKGIGIFAKKEIYAGTVIGDYTGKVIETRKYDLEKDKEGLFLMYFTNEASIYPNLKKPGIHLLNHSCTPNCWIYLYSNHSLFFAVRNIKPGEELTISYLLSPKKDCSPCSHVCKCQSKLCTGTMHLSRDKYKKWQEFQNKQKNKTRRTKPVFGKNLPKLTFYPKKISATEMNLYGQFYIRLQNTVESDSTNECTKANTHFRGIKANGKLFCKLM